MSEDAGPDDAKSLVSSFERQKMENAVVRNKKSVVCMKNVLRGIQRHNGSYYVRNTKIQVPFYKDFLDSLRNDRPLLNYLYVANFARNEPRIDSDHTYCKRVIISEPSLHTNEGFKKARGKGRRKVSSKHKKYVLPSKSSNEWNKVSQKSKHPVLELDINDTQLKRTFSNSTRLQKKSPTRTKTLTESSSNRAKPSFIVDFTEKSNLQKNTIVSNHKTNDPGSISEKSSAKRQHELLPKRTTVGYVNDQVHQVRSRYPDWRLWYLAQQAAASHPPPAEKTAI